MLKRVPYKRCDKVPTLMAPGRNYVLRVRKPSQASARAVRLLGFVIRHEATQDEVDAQREDLGAVSCVPHHVENVAVEKVDVAWSVIQRAENVTNWNLIGVRLLSRSDKRHMPGVIFVTALHVGRCRSGHLPSTACPGRRRKCHSQLDMHAAPRCSVLQHASDAEHLGAQHPQKSFSHGTSLSNHRWLPLVVHENSLISSCMLRQRRHCRRRLREGIDCQVPSARAAGKQTALLLPRVSALFEPKWRRIQRILSVGGAYNAPVLSAYSGAIATPYHSPYVLQSYFCPSSALLLPCSSITSAISQPYFRPTSDLLRPYFSPTSTLLQPYFSPTLAYFTPTSTILLPYFSLTLALL